MFCQYVLLFLAAISVARVTCWTAVIRNPDSGYVLDGTENDVKLQRFKGSQEQYWRVLPHVGMRFSFQNKATGKFLDIEGVATDNAKVITSEEDSRRMRQVWYVSPDDTIMSASPDHLTLDIYGNNVKPGVQIIVYRKHGGRNQKFRLETFKSVAEE